LTVAEWNDNAKLNALTLGLSDILTFHEYNGPETLGKHVRKIKRHDRPAICTEWLHRNIGSTVADCLPIFQHEDIGAIHWGWVNGRMQTHLAMGQRPGDPAPEFWQHDLFRPDLTPYDPREIALFRATIAQAGQTA